MMQQGNTDFLTLVYSASLVSNNPTNINSTSGAGGTGTSGGGY